MLPIYENYRTFTSPRWVIPTVERLLRSLEPEHTVGLESIVLTDAAMIGDGKTRRLRGRKHDRNSCLGFYHRATRSSAAWIELVIDNTISPYPRSSLYLQVVRDVSIGTVLFHEIGHHLHETIGSAARGGEASADDWSRRLSRVHARKRFWYLRALKPVFRMLKRIRARRQAVEQDV